MDGSEAVLRVLLTESDGDWPYLEPSGSEPITVGSQSGGNVIEFGIDIHMIVPESFSNHTGALGDFLVEVVTISVLTPYTGLSSNHIHMLHAWLEAVGLTPVGEVAVVHSIHVVETEVKVSLVFICQDDWVIAAQDLSYIVTDTPPLNSVIFLHRQIYLFISPVDYLLWAHITPDLLLLLTIDQGEIFKISDIAFSHPVSDALLGGPALMHSLVSSQMHILIIEGLVDEAHDLFCYFIGQIDGGVELSHVDAVTIQSEVFILLAPAPGTSVCWGINFRDYTNGPITSILDNTLDVFRRDQAAYSTELTEFRHLGYLHGERVLIDDVPVEHVELGESHRVYGVSDGLHGEEVPRGVDHESTPLKLWSINDLNRQGSHLPLSFLALLEELGEGLKTSHEARVVISSEFPGARCAD